MATRAERAGEGWRLTGRKAVVVNAPAADHILVSARTDEGRDGPEGLSVFLVARGAADLRPYPLVGGGAAAEVTLDGTPAVLVGPEGGRGGRHRPPRRRARRWRCPPKRWD